MYRFLLIIALISILSLLFCGCPEQTKKEEPVVEKDSTEKETPVPTEITGKELAIIKIKGGGEIVLKFYYEDAPKTVENFIKLARKGFYDNLIFHRIIPGFMIQGGDPEGTGFGNAGYTIPAEFNDHPFKKGTIGMARGSDPNSASCQFFICLTREKCKHLDKNYTAFGEVIKGIDVVEKIGKVKTGEKDRPLEPVVMSTVTIEMPSE
jgi:peptidyl-prolyl cis-trans isomerase B (cyclophilin B)